MTRRRLSPAALAIGLVLALPAAATADSTLSVVDGGNAYELASTAAGEANNYLLGYDGTAGEFVFTELAVGEVLLDPGAVCTGNGTQELRCPNTMKFRVYLESGPGNDRIAAAANLLTGFDYTVEGGTGNDVLDGSNFDELLVRGQPGNDTITPTQKPPRSPFGRSLVWPGDGDDTVTESAVGTRVLIFAEPAADGADRLLGGAGYDEVEYEARATRVELSANGVADDGGAGEGDDISPTVDALRSGEGNDLLVASDLVDSQLSGYGGNDELRGGAADDVLFGGFGDDLLDGGGGDDLFPTGDGLFVAIGGGPTEAGADAFIGGAGTDTIEFEGRLGALSITQNGVADDGESGEGDNVGADIETLIGGTRGDTIVASAGAQRIFGGPGGDTIDDGGGAGDYVRGEGHDDTIRVRDGVADDVGCGSGADSLVSDDVDATDGTCEAIDAQLTPKPEPPDTTAPAVTVSKCKKKLKRKRFLRGVRCTVAANEAASWTVALLGRAKQARIAARFNLELASATFTGTGQAVRLRAPRRLLRGSRRFKARLRIVATDEAGNTTTRNRKLRVR